MAQQTGLLRSVLTRVKNAISRRELVGTDAYGNNFYRKVETDFSGATLERRTMEAAHKGDYTRYDPQAVSPQWRQWLSKTRREAPTAAELERCFSSESFRNSLAGYELLCERV